MKAKKRKSIPKSKFGLPGKRKYPMPDKSHARSAKAYASKEKKRGKLTAAEKKRVDAKANKVLGKSKASGGRRKTTHKRKSTRGRKKR